jgi:RNA polymerase sigma factor (sigma-70 family)
VAAANKSQDSDALRNVDRVTGVFVKHGDFVRSLIRFHIKNEAEAEDMFQELFLNLIAKPVPKNVRNIRGFLYKLISDTVKDSFRRSDRYKARIQRYAEHYLQVIGNRPEEGLMDMEEIDKMFSLIERHLPAKEAEAVKLKFRDDIDTIEAARIMGIKPRSVSRYISNGLKKAGQFIGKEQGGNYDSC